VSSFHDIASTSTKDTYAMLSAQQREQHRQHRIAESLAAFRLINKVADKEEWPDEDRENVLGALGLTGEPDNDHGSYGGLMIPRSEPGHAPVRRRSG
jgi:hypothetical protein